MSSPEFPVSNVPPIVYNQKQKQPTASASTTPTATMNTFSANTPTYTPVDATAGPIEKVAFVPMSSTEFVAVPYDSRRYSNLAEVSGSVQSRFHAQSNPKSRSKSPKSAPSKSKTRTKTADDYIFHFYIGSLTMVGLLMLFRIMQKG